MPSLTISQVKNGAGFYNQRLIVLPSVSHAANSNNMTCSYLLTQSAYMNGKGIIVDKIIVIVPNIIEQRCACNDYSAVSDKGRNNLKFNRSNKNIFAVSFYCHIFGINGNITAFIHRAALAPYQRSYA